MIKFIFDRPELVMYSFWLIGLFLLWLVRRAIQALDTTIIELRGDIKLVRGEITSIDRRVIELETTCRVRGENCPHCHYDPTIERKIL